MTILSPSESTPEPPLEHVREDIIAAATRVFSERGYHAASMAEVAEAVGIRKPSLYHHVRRKEDLLFAIHEQLIDELLEQTLEELAESNGPSEEIATVIRVAMGFVARRRDGVTVFLQERHAVTGERWTKLVVKRDRYERLVSGALSRGIEDGAFEDVPPAIAARALLSMANWGHTWFDPKGQLSSDEVAEIFARIVLRGLEVR